MKEIKCPHCSWIVKQCILIILPTTCRYTFGSNYIAHYYTYLKPEDRNLETAIGFDCPHCWKHFPESMNDDIKKVIKAKLILNKLKK